MTALNDIQKSIQLRLRSQSIEVLRSAEKATACIHHLMERGCTIQQLTIRPDYAVIEIDEPGEWLLGSIQVRRINGHYRELVMVTRQMECQVQWVKREAHPLLRREG